ncbi:MAG: 3-phosphoshikimate 1-carboxyvinyltransferase [Clostridia bacterium]|nr:3-phosphoshikimate 1-carboxyvinyltransferase [Clostridia bacterium]
MKVKITPFSPSGKIVAPPSKSVAHRLLIGASLSKGETEIKNVGNSADVIATCSCLRALGAQIELKDGNAVVKGIKNISKGNLLDCNESGSTLRFLMPVACALGADATFTGSQKLLSRPSKALSDELSNHGILVDGWSYLGALKSGRYFIDASVSSQYITGLLFALPILDGDSEIILKGEVVSRNYIEITLSTLDKFKIKYQKSGNSIFIKGNQEFVSPKTLTVEGDWSGSAFPLVLGAVGGQVSVYGLDVNSKQGDKEILSVLEKFGAKIEIQKGFVKVSKDKAKAFTQDFENIPDLAPVCAVLSACAKGESVFTGIQRLKIKESDRVATTIKMLSVAGVTAYEENGRIVIVGSNVKGGVFFGENDHRIVMSSVVLASVANGDSQIVGAEAIEKSYPDFFRDFNILGGNANVDI